MALFSFSGNKKRSGQDISAKKGDRRAKAPDSLMLALEPRYLYDAAALATGLEVVSDSRDVMEAASRPDDTSELWSRDTPDIFPADASVPVDTAQAREIVFVDSRVEDSQQLIDGISPTATVIVLDAEEDGVAQMTRVLNDFNNIQAVHILSHGSEGQISVGRSSLSSENISQYGGMLQQWDQSLTADADIMLYGCGVGGGQTGIDFVTSLAGLTQADVAASDDLSGSSQQGGDWDLEVTVGSIEADGAIDASVDYQDLLATPTLIASTPTLTGITEDQTGSAGQTVAAIAGADISGVAQDGIAIYGTSSGNGTWQFNDGSGWTNVGNVSNSKALLLSDTSSIRFVPDASNATSASISYYAWDASSGIEGIKVDVSTRGAGTDYSSNGDTASITVSAVNDAPVLDNSGTMMLTSISEDDFTSSGTTVSNIIASAGGDRITDVDSGSLEGIAVTGLDIADGSWEYSIDGGNIKASNGNSFQGA